MAVVVLAAAAAVAWVVLGRGSGAPVSWKPLPRAPIVGRIAAGAVWTGDELVVWGGVARTGKVEPVSDGAAYDPSARTWRSLAPAPAGVLGDVGAGAVWTGDAAVFWAGNSPDGPAGGAVYDPETGTWRRLPPGPLGPREGYSAVWTGKELLIVGGTRGDTFATPVGAAVDPVTGSWRRLSALDPLAGLLANGAVWDGREVFVLGRQALCPEQGSTCARYGPVFVAYDPLGDVIRRISLANAPVVAERRSQLIPIAWTGDDVLFSTAGDPTAGIVLYSPRTNAWRTGRLAPCPVPAAGYAQAAWLGNRFVAACGTRGLQVYSPDQDTWESITPGASPLNSREGSAIVWTGKDLIAWSGTVRKPFNPTPADGAFIRLKG